MFEPGQDILCVRGDWTKFNSDGTTVIEGGWPAPPRKGSIHRIVEIYDPCPLHCGGVSCDGVQLHLERHPNEGYCSSGFRPLKKTQTDISVFTEILKKAPAPGRPVKPVPVLWSDLRHGWPFEMRGIHRNSDGRILWIDFN